MRVHFLAGTRTRSCRQGAQVRFSQELRTESRRHRPRFACRRNTLPEAQAPSPARFGGTPYQKPRHGAQVRLSEEHRTKSPRYEGKVHVLAEPGTRGTGTERRFVFLEETGAKSRRLGTQVNFLNFRISVNKYLWRREAYAWFSRKARTRIPGYGAHGHTSGKTALGM